MFPAFNNANIVSGVNTEFMDCMDKGKRIDREGFVKYKATHKTETKITMDATITVSKHFDNR